MKLLFSRFGGKKTKSREIISEFVNHKVYVEPFLGSGAIFLEKNKSVLSVINDLDKSIYNIFNGVRQVSLVKEFDNKEWDWIPDRDRWDLYKKNIYTDNPVSDVDKIFQSLYFIRHSWSGLGKSYTPSRWSCKSNENYKIVLGDYIDKMKDTIVLKKDYKEVIKQFDSDNTLFYLDPPYEIAIKKNYYEHNNGFNLTEFRDTLRNIKGQFILSIDITEQTTELFNEFNLKVIDFNYQTRKKNKDVKEYIITNFKKNIS